jgi:hypothetical protein
MMTNQDIGKNILQISLADNILVKTKVLQGENFVFFMNGTTVSNHKGNYALFLHFIITFIISDRCDT